MLVVLHNGDSIMGPFGLTTISNIQALSRHALTVICPPGAPIDGLRCFTAQCVTSICRRGAVWALLPCCITQDFLQMR